MQLVKEIRTVAPGTYADQAVNVNLEVVVRVGLRHV